MNIVPPEVPKLEPEKKGFFKRLFSIKRNSENNTTNVLKEEDKKINDYDKEEKTENIAKKFIENQTKIQSKENLSSEISNLPDLPDFFLKDTSKNSNEKNIINLNSLKEYSTENKKNKNILLYENNFDANNALFKTNQNFDWFSSISPQESIILDNNRNNEDIRNLLNISNQHIQEQKSVLNNKLLSLPGNISKVDIKTPVVPDIKVDPIPIIKSERLFFNKVDKEHKKLREKIRKNINKYKKEEFLKLLKQYDDKIESFLEQKQLEYSNKANQLLKLSKELNLKQKELSDWNKQLKSLEEKLKIKEKEIEKIINNTVEKQLIKRTKKEREMLKKELQKTISMNNILKKKIELIQKDREELEKIKKSLIDNYQKKEEELQNRYNFKFEELKKEKIEFEERRKKAIELLHKAELIRKEKENLDKLKDILEKKKKSIKEAIKEDIELKNTIEESERRLAEERTNLDNMIFSKYIKWKLSDEKEKEDISEILRSPEVDEINKLIVECRSKLVNNDIKEAKRIYNDIKNKFENSKIDDYNKSLLFNSIMELFNDIKIAMLKM